VLAEAEERLAHLVPREEFGCAAGVLCGDDIDLAQGPEGPEAQVFKVPDWRSDDEEGAGHGSLRLNYNVGLDEDEDMPLYEYQCEVCGHRFEKIQKFSDPPLETCPSCDGVVRKLISSPAFQFKGTGWYVTDYAKTGGDAGGKDTKDSSSGKTEPTASSEKAADKTSAAESKTGKTTDAKDPA